MRIRWGFTFETPPPDPNARPSSVLVRWAVVGLAVLGVAALVVFRVWTR